MKTLMMSATLAALSVAVVPAFAQAQDTGVYGTLGYAGSRADGADTGAIQGRLGTKLTPHFGVEGELSGGVKDDNIDTNGVRSSIEQTHSAAAYAVGFLPVTPNIDLLARVGYGNTQFKQTLGGVESKFDADSVNYGVGAQYKVDDKNGVRVDYTRQQFRDNDAADANVVSVGYARKF
ncbi:porin family protein [Caulobacter soli]|uniref:porin family protein n=1 Tax=Caulobacter soli TaxID=2708539 RepID=UPI0013EDCFC2|nr:porin family protein [Caulobacter soli]